MSLQQPDLNKPAFRIDDAKRRKIQLGKCPTCDAWIYEEDFRDPLSKKEYSISGMCQKCQDSVFGCQE
jgi:hypothetical protein